MIEAMLLMLVGGITLSQAVSNPRQVTLRWLRLGGILAVTLLAVTVVVGLTAGSLRGAVLILVAAAVIACVVQLITVQKAMHASQRVAALLAFPLAAVAGLGVLATVIDAGAGEIQSDPTALRHAGMICTVMIASPLLGGFLMTMLVGHAYLTAGHEMTQRPFARLVVMLAVLLVLRLVVASVFGLVPYVQAEIYSSRAWNMMLITSRFVFGLILPGVFTWMVYDCVRRQANQSATGILYVALLMVVLGEGTALTLLDATGFVF